MEDLTGMRGWAGGRVGCCSIQPAGGWWVRGRVRGGGQGRGRGGGLGALREGFSSGCFKCVRAIGMGERTVEHAEAGPQDGYEGQLRLDCFGCVGVAKWCLTLFQLC